MQKNIILTGFMGTGKTTVDTLPAKKLGYGFVDTDPLIKKMSDVAYRLMTVDNKDVKS